MTYQYIDLPDNLKFEKGQMVYVNGTMAKGVGEVIMTAAMTKENWPPKGELMYGLRGSEPFPQMAVELRSAENYGQQIHYNAQDITDGKVRLATEAEIGGVTGITNRSWHPFVVDLFKEIKNVSALPEDTGLDAALSRYKESLKEPHPANVYANLLFGALKIRPSTAYTAYLEFPEPVNRDIGYRICDDVFSAIGELIMPRMGINVNVTLDWDSANNKLFSRAKIDVSFDLASFLSGGQRTGGYGRDYYLEFDPRGICHITGERGMCLVFDSSDGEYSSLSISLDLVEKIHAIHLIGG